MWKYCVLISPYMSRMRKWCSLLEARLDCENVVEMTYVSTSLSLVTESQQSWWAAPLTVWACCALMHLQNGCLQVCVEEGWALFVWLKISMSPLGRFHNCSWHPRWHSLVPCWCKSANYWLENVLLSDAFIHSCWRASRSPPLMFPLHPSSAPCMKEEGFCKNQGV